jgi:hypothetical protein
MADLANEITNSLPRNGVAPMSGALAMGSNKITGLATGTAAADAVTKAQMDAVSAAYIAADAAHVAAADPHPGYQLEDVELTALAGLTSAADKVPYFTGSGTAAVATLTAYARTILDDADAGTARTTLGVVAATTSTAGLLEIATAAEVLAGTSETLAVTPGFFADNASLGASGHYKLPGGLTIQWGRLTGVTIADATVTFPTAFTTACYNVQITIESGGTAPISTKDGGPMINSYTTTGFVLEGGTDTGYYGGVFHWMAIGV